MPGLEQTSPNRWVRPASLCRLHHAPQEQLPRHVHEAGFASVVLSGGYVEAGDTGRHQAEPGDVVLHQPYEFHLDRFRSCGAEVLVVPVTRPRPDFSFGRLADPDAIARICESDPATAEHAMFEQLVPRSETESDWPDLLARAVRDNPSLSVINWARNHSLAVGSVSRGFGQVYGISPASYRLLQRTHRAIREILETDASLSCIAQGCGFADQAHMTRSVHSVTAFSPRALRVSRATIERCATGAG